jgi:hypothetical protein
MNIDKAFKISLAVFITALSLLLVIILSTVTFPISSNVLKEFPYLQTVINVENWLGVPDFIITLLSALSSLFTFIAKTLK